MKEELKEKVKRLRWTYRFNENVEIDDNLFLSVNGELVTIEELQKNIICKSCRIHKISKGNGEYRYVYAPNTKYKKLLQEQLPHIEEKLNALDTRNMFHAFRKNRNVVTNAKAHIGWKYSAKFDLKSFFDTVKKEHLPEDLQDDLLFIKGVTRQGLPTSPLVASIALLPHVYAIEDELRQKYDVRMTVYADDITVSFNDRTVFEDIKQIVYKHIKAAGFKINYRKTKLKFGHKPGMRRIICGIGVGSDKVYPTRDVKRKLRAMMHNGSDQIEIAGLLEWARCKPPRRQG